MEKIFYFLGMIPIMVELYYIFNTELVNSEKDFVKKADLKNPEDNLAVVKQGCGVHGVGLLFYAVWNIVGLFTFQSGLFAMLLIIGIVSSKVKESNLLWHRTDSVICICTILLIIYNYSVLQIGLRISDIINML
jgi:hypothetical protein